VFDDVYSGIGTTKLEAKMNAAANAVDALQSCGVVAAREQELKAERREAEWLKPHAERLLPEIPCYDHRMFGQSEIIECVVTIMSICAIVAKWCEIGPRLLLITNRKLQTLFQMR